MNLDKHIFFSTLLSSSLVLALRVIIRDYSVIIKVSVYKTRVRTHKTAYISSILIIRPLIYSAAFITAVAAPLKYVNYGILIINLFWMAGCETGHKWWPSNFY